MEKPEKKEETQETEEEVDTEETDEESEVNTKEYSDNEKQLYARAKKAEKEAKEVKLKLKELEKKPELPVKKEEKEPIDAIKIAKLANSLKDYDEEELTFADILSKGKGVSLEEAIATDEFKTYIGAMRDKKQEDNMVTTPNGKQVANKKENPFVKKFSQNLPKGFDYTK